MIFRRILLKLSRRRRLERDMEAEFAFHREMACQQANPIGLGNVTRMQEEARDLWRFGLLEDFWRDVVYAVRSFARTPGFATVVILTLALGIGANTAIFTLIHRVMLASLPVRQPDQLIEILGIRGGGPPGVAFSYPALQNLRSHTQVCSSIIGFSNIEFHAVIQSDPMERVAGQLVTGDYFSALGVSMVRGRPLMSEDDQAGNGNAVVVLSHSMWQYRYGGNADAIGKTLLLENVPFTIVGVAPAGFYGLEVGRQNDVWIPLESERRIRRPSFTSSAAYKWLQMIGRLKPGATIEEAQAELLVLYRKSVIENEIAELEREDPRFNSETANRMRAWSLTLVRASNGLSRTRKQYSTPLLVLMTIVGALLLIACTSVANLLFARALAREKEIALRMSLGARRSRLIRQVLTESSVLVVIGGTLGLFAAYLLTKYLTAFLSNSSGFSLDVAPDLVTLGFTAAIAVFAVVIFGLIPAFRSTDMDFGSKLKGTGSGWWTVKGHRWTGGLIVVQVAVLLVLVLGAGLLLRTLHNLNSINLGFDRNNVLFVTLDPFGSGRTEEQLAPLSMQLLERIESLPGVKAATVTRFEPISNGSGINLSFSINREGTEPALARDIWVNSVGTKYFATLRIPLIAGREFSPQDSNSPERVVIVNQAFAERYFGKVSPIGKTITTRGTPMEIIGLVANAKYSELRGDMEPTVYQNIFQRFGTPLKFFIRTEREPETIAAAIRSEFRSVIGNVTLTERLLSDHIDSSIVRERMVTHLAAIFGGLALVLAVIGLYGVVNNSVVRRTREIGIRIALGFDRRSVVSMVLSEVLALVGGGIVLGLPLAIVVTRSAGSLLYGLAPDDPLTVIGSVAALLLSALAAGFIPARRAARVDPMTALRSE